MDKKQWSGKTYGNGWMHRWLISFLRHVDVRFLYLFTAVFILPVCLITNRSRKTAYTFFRSILGMGRWRAVWMTYLNHYHFAQAVIDKFAMYAGKRFDVEVDYFDEFADRANRDEGFLHFSAHVGNYEIAGYTLVSQRKKIHAVVYGFEKESVMRNRTGMFDKTNISMISMKEDMSHLYEIDNALCNGDIVSFPTDRSAGAVKCVEVMFLGRKTKFPMGPFSVATMRSLDVLAVNVMKVNARKYKAYITPLNYDKSAPRREQIKQLSEAYAAELEKRVREYPTQWFNFYDFWS